MTVRGDSSDNVVEQTRLVMFDHDGVIVDSLDVFAAAFIDACAAVGIEGFTQVDDLLAVMDDNFYAGMRARGAADADVEVVLRRVGQALVRARPWLRPFPLVPQVLAELAEAFTVMIVTSSPGEVVEGWLRRHAVKGVDSVLGAEAGSSKTEKMQALMARFPGQTAYWYVGDTAGDIREAREAGATPLGVAWGWHEPRRLVEAGAERIAASPADLLTIIAPGLAHDFFGV